MADIKQLQAGIATRITNYLGNGGLWNPESMEHAKVRDLLIDVRDDLLPALEAFWRSWFCKHHLPTKPHPQGTCFVCNASAMLRSQSLRFAAEIDWWHRYWHRDTGIPCDGTMEVCKRAEQCRAEHMPGLEAHDTEVRDRALHNLASAIKKVCPEVIPQIISAANPEEEFIAFLRGSK